MVFCCIEWEKFQIKLEQQGKQTFDVTRRCANFEHTLFLFIVRLLPSILHICLEQITDLKLLIKPNK